MRDTIRQVEATWERLVNVWRVQASISNLLFCRGAARVADRRTSALNLRWPAPIAQTLSDSFT